MFNYKIIKEYPIKKCKGFGYTFSLVFLVVALYFFFKVQKFQFFFNFFVFFLLTIYYPACFKLPAFVWEKFGVLLGKFISPIVLTLIYAVTILPVNLLLKNLFYRFIG